MKKRHGTAQNCSLQRFFPSVFQPFQGIKKSKMVARWIYKNANKQGFIYAVHSISNIPKNARFLYVFNTFHQKKRLQLDNFFIYFYLISYVLFNVFIVFFGGGKMSKNTIQTMFHLITVVGNVTLSNGFPIFFKLP